MALYRNLKRGKRKRRISYGPRTKRHECNRDGRNAWHRAREEFMVQGMLRAAGHDPAAVIVCGLDHVVGIVQLLTKQGHAVEQLKVSQANGFDLRWLDSNLGGSQHAG